MLQLRPMTLDDLPLFARWLSAPHVARWYHDLEDWLDEVKQMHGAYRWITHFIAEKDGAPIGFCQYYPCRESGEPMGGYGALDGSYSLDYLIGEVDCLRKGYGRAIVALLLERIARLPDAQRVVVEPESGNDASRALLRASGFRHDAENDVFVRAL